MPTRSNLVTLAKAAVDYQQLWTFKSFDATEGMQLGSAGGVGFVGPYGALHAMNQLGAWWNLNTESMNHHASCDVNVTQLGLQGVVFLSMYLFW